MQKAMSKSICLLASAVLVILIAWQGYRFLYAVDYSIPSVDLGVFQDRMATNGTRYLNLYDTRYINLESRKDRRALIEAELARTGVCCAERVDAVSFPKKDRTNRWGLMGCAVSHMRALASTRAPVAFVLEDDALFQRQPPLIELETPSFLWHVLLFAYNGRVDNARCVVAHGNRWCRVFDAQTASMYAVRKTYIPQLLHVLNESFRGLSLGKPVPEFANDQKWKELQKKDGHFWYAAVPRIGIQRPNYSDIEGTKVNYGV